MKKRILVLLSAVAPMVVMLAMSVAPAFARANDNASCPGRAASDANSQSPGAGGALISSVASSDPGSIGEAASEGCI